MSTYYTYCGTGTSLAINVGVYEIRIASIQIYSASSNGTFVGVYRYDAARASSGTSQLVVPLRQGAPAASSTSIFGNSLSISSGNYELLNEVYVPPGAVTPGSATYYTTYPGSATQIQSPLTYTVGPGGVLYITGLIAGSLACNVFFEELRLAGSY